MQKQVAEVALSTAMMLYEQRIAEQEMRVRNLEAELYTAQVCLDNSKRVRMEFARFVERNDKRAPPTAEFMRAAKRPRMERIVRLQAIEWSGGMTRLGVMNREYLKMPESAA